ncbi:MAG: tetratricopeptide repeat protein [Bacteroidota bacterium]|jgi:predicted Zn-dependent protease
MKKLLLIAAFGLSAAGIQAQNKNIVSAINSLNYYLKDKSADDLLDAKKFIDEAAANEETSQKAKTWYNRAKIYNAINECKDPKLAPYLASAIDEMLVSYQKTVKLDEKNNYPDAKQGLKYCISLVNNKAIDDYNNKNYADALSGFEKTIELRRDALNITDTMGYLSAGVCAEKSNNFQKALDNYKRIKELKYPVDKDSAKIYYMIAGVYRTLKDDAGYIAVISEGRKNFPNDKNLIFEELNYYLTSGKIQEAVNNLQLAISKDPKNPVLYYNLGTLYDNMANPREGKAPTQKEFDDYFGKASAQYDLALQMNPNYFDALYNKGAMYFNRAVKMNDATNNIKDPKKYEAESKKVDAAFKESLPILEKAETIGTEDKETLQSLLQTLQKLYMMTEQQDKAKAIRAKMSK